jgi:hypothetical protein
MSNRAINRERVRHAPMSIASSKPTPKPSFVEECRGLTVALARQMFDVDVTGVRDVLMRARICLTLSRIRKAHPDALKAFRGATFRDEGCPDDCIAVAQSGLRIALNPAAMAELSNEQQQHVIAHELAHVGLDHPAHTAAAAAGTDLKKTIVREMHEREANEAARLWGFKTR